jgi:hypothetical protein
VRLSREWTRECREKTNRGSDPQPLFALKGRSHVPSPDARVNWYPRKIKVAVCRKLPWCCKDTTSYFDALLLIIQSKLEEDFVAVAPKHALGGCHEQAVPSLDFLLQPIARAAWPVL